MMFTEQANENIHKTYNEFSAVFGWSIDMIRAFEMRPIWAKLLLRFILGRYAFNEFIGLRKILKSKHYIDMGYELENMDYHQEKVPLRWWLSE